VKKLLAAVAISTVSATAMAQDKGWYAGGGFGQSKAKDFCNGLTGAGVSCDDTDVAIKALGGYQFTRNFALEFGATNAGSVEARGPGGRLTVDTGIAEAAAVGILPLGDRFSVFGKFGLYSSFVEWELRTTTLNDDERKTNSDFTYGIGLGFAITPKLVLRAEWQRYQDVDGGNIGKSDVDLMILGLVYRFF
jgi:OOP family OmpA-OmpF porin